MRTSLTEIQEIENFLAGKMPGDEALLFEAKQLIDFSLRENTTIQRQIADLVKHFGRQKLKRHLAQVHDRIFRDPSKSGFQNKIHNYFTN